MPRNAIVTEIKDDDIYRWSARTQDGDAYSYWCKSQIAVAKNGRLYDTYWGCSGDVSWDYARAIATLNLEFLGNFADLEKVSEWNGAYFDASDCVDINHPNSTKGNFYVRKGAERSAAKMLETARCRREIAAAAARYAESRLTRAEEVIRQIESGQSLNDIWF